MAKIYFVLTNTGTVLSHIISFFMKDEMAHVSLSFDKKLKRMYSFGRLNPYNPFYGGFIREAPRKRTFKRFKNTKSIILEVEITENQYEKLEQTIKEFKQNRKNYKFNIIGLFAVYFNKKIKRENYFYCAEFIKFIVENAGIENNLPELVRPEHFKEFPENTVIYRGLINEYR